MTTTVPRGIRNNNPGNIEIGSPWQGLAAPEEMTPEQRKENRFCVFVAPKWGIRAIARVLITYQDKRKANDGSRIDTLREFIERWAPASENDVNSYVRSIRKRMGLSEDDPVAIPDITDYEIMRNMVIGIIWHENGMQPYDDLTIDEGLRLAGIEIPVKPVSQSREIRGQQVALGGVLGGMASEIATSLSDAAGMLQPLIAHADAIKWAFVALTLIGICFTVWARLRANVEGVR